jgi:hypothetical protein
MTTTRNVTGAPTPDVIPEDTPLELNGAAVAAMVAAGIGCLAMGIATTAAEASEGIRNGLNLYNPVGPLSGKSVLAIIVWLIAWFLLHRFWRSRQLNFQAMFIVTLVLIGLGALLTFPPVFLLFAPPE